MPVLETKGAASSQGFGEFALQARGPVQAEAIDFDGTSDVLSRADLTGNISSRTFTFSAFLYRTSSATNTFIYNVNNGSLSQFFWVNFSSGGTLSITGRNSGGTNILAVTGTGAGAGVPLNTWISLLVSVDLANTSNRYIYVNDRLVTGTWTTYTNQQIAFPQTTHTVAAYDTTFGRQRLSNVFLDYTYRNLSVEANRRLFVTADLKPAAGQAALSPIMYLPMSNPTAPGTNAGTGGNFALTGVVARSGRGPNQYNAPYSVFNGSDQRLERNSALTGIANSKTFTISFAFQRNVTGAGNERIVELTTGGSDRFSIKYDGTSIIEIFAASSSGDVLAAKFTAPTMVTGRNYVLTISIDLANTSNRYVYFNGQAASVTWNTYVDSAIQFAPASPDWCIGASVPAGPGRYYNGQLGALWFNTSYINLSVPANLAKFVTGTGIDAAPADLGATGQLPTGTSPILYLPMYSNAPSRNYGTGGDIPQFGSNFAGARGPNEFWGNLAFTNAGGWLSKTSSIGVSDGKVFSFSMYFRRTASGNTTVFLITNNQGVSGAPRLQILLESGGDPSAISVSAWDSSGTQVLNARQGAIVNIDTLYHFCGYIDLSNTSNRGLYLNGSLMSPTWTTYTNADIDLSPATPRYWIGGEYSTPSGNWTGVRLSEFYFTTSYIDFSQEANRLKFRDAFGNPVNLAQQIEALAIPNPAVYMRFPPTAFGTNSGTGGDFTVNGIISDGGQI
jgi:hypothetical protein